MAVIVQFDYRCCLCKSVSKNCLVVCGLKSLILSVFKLIFYIIFCEQFSKHLPSRGVENK